MTVQAIFAQAEGRSIDLWTVLIVLLIICALLYIFARFRR